MIVHEVFQFTPTALTHNRLYRYLFNQINIIGMKHCYIYRKSEDFLFTCVHFTCMSITSFVLRL